MFAVPNAMENMADRRNRFEYVCFVAIIVASLIMLTETASQKTYTKISSKIYDDKTLDSLEGKQFSYLFQMRV